MPERIIFVPNILGECGGVNRSNRFMAEVIDRVGGENVVLSHLPTHYGPTNRRFAKTGAVITEIPDSATAKGKIVIGSPHGSSPDTIKAWLDAGAIEFLDTVCPLVVKPRDEMANFLLNAQGGVLMGVYIGHQGHRETEEFLASFPGQNLFLVEKPADVETLPNKADRVMACWQTTLGEEVDLIVLALQAKYSGKLSLPKQDDRCLATRVRRGWTSRLLNEFKIDLQVVVGSLGSSNTMRYVEIAERAKPPVLVLMIETVKELKGVNLKSYNRLGLNAGAAVSPGLAFAVADYFEDIGYQKKAIFVANEGNFTKPVATYT